MHKIQKKHLSLGLGLAGALALAGCSTAQQASFTSGAAKVSSALQLACTDAIGVANIAGLVPGVGAIEPYIMAGCATAEGLAKLASDPSSTQWVGQLIGQVKGLAAQVGMKL